MLEASVRYKPMIMACHRLITVAVLIGRSELAFPVILFFPIFIWVNASMKTSRIRRVTQNLVAVVFFFQELCLPKRLMTTSWTFAASLLRVHSLDCRQFRCPWIFGVRYSSWAHSLSVGLHNSLRPSIIIASPKCYSISCVSGRTKCRFCSNKLQLNSFVDTFSM